MTMWRTNRRAALALMAILAGASGCASLLPGPQAPAALYSLDAPTTFTGLGPQKLPWTLVVDDPTAGSGLDTDRIAVRETPLRVRYYADARWAEPAPQMARDLIISAFENADRLEGVGQSSVTLNPKYRLSTRLDEFEAVYPDGAKAPEVRVKLDATLVKELGGDVVGSRDFAASRQAASVAVPDVVNAFNRATDAVLSDLVTWTLKTPPATS
jgi:cholesterol transport system auxiliary component